MKFFRQQLSSIHIQERIRFTAILFIIVFFTTVILSYLFLPQELLKNKNPLQNWQPGDTFFVLALQIFFYNLLSVVIIILASLFGKKKKSEKNYLSVGYLVFFVLIVINGIVLGTWSFSVDHEPEPIVSRLFFLFDVSRRAGLWEMVGQMLITCALAHIAVVLTSGKKTVTRMFHQIHLSKEEKVVLVIGFLCMLIGAGIESNAILTS